MNFEEIAMKDKLKAGRKFTLILAALLLAPAFARAGEPAKPTARNSPAWLRDGVIYEIFPRDFSPAGNLNGVTAQLDRLKDLGVTVLWVMPIHPIGEKARKGDFGSPYSIKDYYAVDPNYGTLDDFKNLVAGAHQRGLKVIMDLVANHTSWDNVLIIRPKVAALQTPRAKGRVADGGKTATAHPEFYKHDTSGNIISPEPGWSDVAGLNYANPQLREYMIAMMKYWIQTSDIDGFRCDVAWGVPVDFWEQARAALENSKPDIIMLAEASQPDLLTNAFDIDYSWPLLHALNDVLERGAPASRLQATWEENVRLFPTNSLHLDTSDDHDEARAVARFGIQGALAASALMFSLDGVPLLYNGMEVGDATESGDPALFDKLPIVWSPRERPPLGKIYQGLIQLRKQYPAFTNNRVIWLNNSDPANLVSLMRLDNNDEFVVVINFSNRPVSGKVEVMNSRDFQPVQISSIPKPAAGDFPLFHLGGFEWRIYHRVVPH
jgi:cyclomaltodextrinase / maltogenic alpha-amylase / neopullulanase